jgi:putative transposase
MLKSKLPRLSRAYYQGRAVVFWTHTFENRATGWLNVSFHGRFREVLIHACARYGIAWPIYILMPDHLHVVWMGLADGTDQHTATKYLRKHLAPHLGPARLQDRPHDHVLPQKDRKRNAFMATCSYVAENAARGGLVNNWKDWTYLGSVIPGYPDLDPRTVDFWPDFWKIYNRYVDATPQPGSPEPGYNLPSGAFDVGLLHKRQNH